MVADACKWQWVFHWSLDPCLCPETLATTQTHKQGVTCTSAGVTKVKFQSRFVVISGFTCTIPLFVFGFTLIDATLPWLLNVLHLPPPHSLFKLVKVSSELPVCCLVHETSCLLDVWLATPQCVSHLWVSAWVLRFVLGLFEIHPFSPSWVDFGSLFEIEYLSLEPSSPLRECRLLFTLLNPLSFLCIEPCVH